MTGVDLGRYKRIVQYFWDPEPQNDDPTLPPIWCLGQQYLLDPAACGQLKTDGPRDQTGDHVISAGPLGEHAAEATDVQQQEVPVSSPRGEAEQIRGWPPAFLDDFESRIWLTYRSNFPPIPRSHEPGSSSSMSLSVRLRSQFVEHDGFTSDMGWGCMIRSGQCLLANALLLLHLGRGWRRGTREDEERKILSLFADDPSAPFSIHQFVQHGASECGKHPGEWFGPSATARCIQALSNQQQREGLRVYITGDGSDVYQDSFMKVARGADMTFRPTLVLVGIRLGIDRITPVYWDSLKATLQMSQSVGIAGGRPSSSHYFIGVQGPYFFYLDPHHTRPALPSHAQPEDYTPEDIASCHTRRLRRIHITEMDPSMLIAFLIRDEEDWRTWRASLDQVTGKKVIHVADHEPTLHGHDSEREGALDEVEALDDEDGLDSTETVMV